MSEPFKWKCWRFWYQGPPGARGCYAYRTTYAKPWLWWRILPEGVLIGTRHYHIYYAWRWR